MLTHWFEPVDEAFLDLVLPNTQVETLWSGGRWVEGPVYVPASRHLLFSDIPNDRVMRWDEQSGHVSQFDGPCGFQNGHTLDRQGRVLACEHGGRRVSRREHDGSITTIADRWDGMRLNSPNDVVVRSDGSIWFTDPTYGIDSDYEGARAMSEIGHSHVYRVDPVTNTVEAVIRTMKKPNGLAFSADERTLFVVDSGKTHDPNGPAHIRRFAVTDEGAVEDQGVFATCQIGVFDGLRLDELGNVWVGAGDGVHCLAPDGRLIGKIRLPEVASNLAFGELKKNRMFICATSSVYAVYVKVCGVDYYDNI